MLCSLYKLILFIYNSITIMPYRNDFIKNFTILSEQVS